MEHLAKAIQSTCKQIVEQPNIKRVFSLEEYRAFFSEVKNRNKSHHQMIKPSCEIVMELDNKFQYAHLKKDISFSLFKQLTKIDIPIENEEKVLPLFEGKREVIKEEMGHFLMVQPGDVELFLHKSRIEAKISPNKFEEKYGAFLLGEDSFIKERTPGNRGDGLFSIIPAAQEDLQVILKGLKRLI